MQIANTSPTYLAICSFILAMKVYLNALNFFFLEYPFNEIPSSAHLLDPASLECTMGIVARNNRAVVTSSGCEVQRAGIQTVTLPLIICVKSGRLYDSSQK